MFMIRLPAVPVDTRTRVISPTEIQLGDKLYYVARLPPKPKPAAATDPVAQAAANAVRGSRGSAPSPAPAAKSGTKGSAASKPSKVEIAQAKEPEAPRQAAARQFIPPEAKKNANTDQTLIQPLSPPNIQLQDTNLPTFQAWTGQIPKIPKPFVAPGRTTPPPPDAQPVLTPPKLELTSAVPITPKSNPALALPLPPPPLEQPDFQPDTNAPPLIPQGDPVNILAVTRNPVLPVQTLVVPQGNVVGVTGKDLVTGAAGGTGTAATGAAASAKSNGANGSGSSAPKSGGALAGNGSGSGSGIAGTGANGAGSGGTGTTGTGLAGSGTATAAGTGAGGSGTGSANGPGGTGSGPGKTMVAGNGSGLGSGSSGGPGNGNAAADSAGTGTGKPGTVVINRPATGSFDAVVVQSSPLDILPGRKDLLSGRPIYTVYLTVGTSKDWTLYFCVPGEEPKPQSQSTIVKLTSAAPVIAPYPTRMVRPLVALPRYQKFLLVHGFVSDSGKVERLRIVDPGVSGVDDAVMASIIDWQFRAATRDGQPISVEFLLAIPQAGL